MIEAFIIAWNESETIHLTIKHYQQYCEKITIYDNHSTDDTPDIARSMGCEVVQFGNKLLDDKEYLKVKNHCYKKSKAKYVIVCDCDEILDLSDFKDDDATIFNTWGFDIYSDLMPVNSFLEIKTGIYSQNYSKNVIFSPKVDINFVYGCHVCHPRSRLRYSDQLLTLFHYRNIGGVERLCKRHAIYRERLSPNNKHWNLGVHYTYEDERRIKEFNETKAKCVHYSLVDRDRMDKLPF